MTPSERDRDGRPDGRRDGEAERRAEVAPSDALRRRVLGIADPATRWDGFAARAARLFDLPEASARAILAEAAGGRGFEAGPADGMELFHLRGGAAVADAHCGLVRLAPGASVPRHRHQGAELTLVLGGAAEESGGERWQPGDVVVREAGSAHALRALGDEPFVFAVVLRGEFAPTGD